MLILKVRNLHKSHEVGVTDWEVTFPEYTQENLGMCPLGKIIGEWSAPLKHDDKPRVHCRGRAKFFDEKVERGSHQLQVNAVALRRKRCLSCAQINTLKFRSIF